MSTARTPLPQQQDGGGAGAGAAAPPTNPRGQNPTGPFVNRGEDVRAALENAERLVAQTTTRLAAEEASATALDQQVQAMQAQGPSILAALDSQTTNKVPRWGRAARDFSAELWLNQVENAEDHEQMDRGANQRSLLPVHGGGSGNLETGNPPG